MSSYTDRLKEYIGKSDGREDHFNLKKDEIIPLIKDKLKTNYSCNLWTFEWSNNEIDIADRELTEAGIVHCFDEVMDALVCFQSEEAMEDFYVKLRNEIPPECLENIRRNYYNTPLTKNA